MNLDPDHNPYYKKPYEEEHHEQHLSSEYRESPSYEEFKPPRIFRQTAPVLPNREMSFVHPVKVFSPFDPGFKQASFFQENAQFRQATQNKRVIVSPDSKKPSVRRPHRKRQSSQQSYFTPQLQDNSRNEASTSYYNRGQVIDDSIKESLEVLPSRFRQTSIRQRLRPKKEEDYENKDDYPRSKDIYSKRVFVARQNEKNLFPNSETIPEPSSFEWGKKLR